MFRRDDNCSEEPEREKHGSLHHLKKEGLPKNNGDPAVNVEEENGHTSENKKFTKVQCITFIMLAIGNFGAGACLSLQAPFFPQEAELKGATPTEYGFVFGIYHLTMFIAAPLMGKLSSHLGAKLMLNIGIFTIGLTCLLFGFLDYIQGRVSFVITACVLRSLEGAGCAAWMTACYSILAVEFPDSMSTAVASVETFYSTGLIIGPVIGGALYDLEGFGLPFYFLGVLLLIDALIVFVVLPKPEYSKNPPEEKMWKFWTHPSTFVYASAIFSAFVYLGFNHALLEPHIRQFQLSGVYVGLLFGTQGLCCAISSPICGWLCDYKCKAQFVALFGYISIMVSLLLIGPMPFLKLESGIHIIIIALIFLGFGAGEIIIPSFTGCLQDTVARGFPEGMSTYTLVSSMVVSAESLGAFVGPSMGGYLLDTKGYISGVTAVLSIVLISFSFFVLYTTVGRRFLLKKPQSTEKQPVLEKHHIANSVKAESEI